MKRLICLLCLLASACTCIVLLSVARPQEAALVEPPPTYPNIASLPTPERDKPPYLGEWKISFYTPAADENGGYEGVTCTGAPIVIHQTAACAEGALPLGTEIYIDGVGYRTIEDYGCQDGTIDVAVETKAEAFELGVFTAGVWLCCMGGV